MKDIEIANQVKLAHIKDIAQKLNLSEDDIELYGKYKAKIPLKYIDYEKMKGKKLILVTAISPTPAGEGKTTVSIGLSEGLNQIGHPSVVVLREPSLGPVFGIKGGATGGGYAQVLPMEDINLHFTGDFSAIEKANNLLAALIDNNIQSKSKSLNIDPRTVSVKRVMDMNDRALRNIVISLGGKGQGIPRESGFNITAASEVMAILCLANDNEDLKNRLGNIFVGFTFDNKPIYARDLKAEGAMAALLKDAINPNLVQTIEGNPAIIHGGPFANIAQGTNSVIATRMGLTLTKEFVVTEAGFGADLGAEKFLDIKCVSANLNPDAVVLVATIRALKYHGGADLKTLTTENVAAVQAGLVNLEKHIENIKSFNIQPIIAINQFVSDTPAEIAAVVAHAEKLGVAIATANVWAKGGAGARDLAEKVAQIAHQNSTPFTPAYAAHWSIPEKIEKIAKSIYGADGVNYDAKAKDDLKTIAELGLNHLPICMAKTQKSLSDNPALLGRPSGFMLTIREIEIASGAGFVVPIAGEMMRMPGLPATPAAESITIDNAGKISGLF
jgi:formate--tetrahydrofolate ligase